jgi:predicted alpha-1,2-mannosidase
MKRSHEETMPKPMSRRAFAGLSATSLAGACISTPSFSLVSAVASNNDRAKRINPLIGASTNRKLGEGKTFPGATTPFGLVQLSPDTITGGDNAPGYSYDHTTIEGFSFLHMSGVGWYGDFGNLQVMPTRGPMKLACGRLDHPDEGWRSKFSHSTETANANYYAVTLDETSIRTEVAAAPHAGILRFTFPEGNDSRIQIDLARRIAGTSSRQFVKVVGKNAIEGWMKCVPTGGGWGNGHGKADYTVYFRMEFSRPLKDFGAWSIAIPEGGLPSPTKLISDQFQTDEYYALVKAGTVTPNIVELEGNHLGFYTEFATHAGEQVLAKAGVSLVSMDGAANNLAHDIPGWDFDEVHRTGRKLWSDVLRKIDVEGATEEQSAIFATAMYHAMIDPRIVSDVDGSFTAADGKIRKSDLYRRRTIFSGWDVFRAVFPLMSIIDPTLVSDEINSLVDLANESGKGYLERWEIVNAYSGCMDGDPAISVINDAYQKGIRTFDIDKAYAACRQTSSGNDHETNRPDNEFYLTHGYVPGRVSWTLDNAYYDWCVGRMAHGMGKEEDAQMYFRRAHNYANIYDPNVQSMHAKDSNGQWAEWKGRTTFGQGCTESNPGQQTWFVPHDVQGLINLMGHDAFVSELEAFFEQTPNSFDWNPFYNHADEPVHQIAYLFVYAGKPWLTQKWVRRILEQAYRNDVNGICGNDDVGQMSAWYVLSALGFYPVCPGDNTYILGSPLFTKATIRFDPKYHRGKSFVITAKNNSSENLYIQSATLNGKSLKRAWITHDEVTNGGTLEFVMGSHPNQQWAVAPEHVPPSMSRTSNA